MNVSSAGPSVRVRQIDRRRIHHRSAPGNPGDLVQAQTRIGSFGGRVGFVVIAGLLAAITTNVSYWNWCGLPAVNTASYMLIEIVGFVLVGVIAGLMLRRRIPAA